MRINETKIVIFKEENKKMEKREFNDYDESSKKKIFRYPFTIICNARSHLIFI